MDVYFLQVLNIWSLNMVLSFGNTKNIADALKKYEF